MRSRLLFSIISVSALSLFFLAAPPAESQKGRGGFGRGAPGGFNPGGAAPRSAAPGSAAPGGMAPGGAAPRTAAPGGAAPGTGRPSWGGGMLTGGGDPEKLFEILSKGRGFFLVTDSRSPALRDPLMHFATEQRITNGQITRDQFMTFWKTRMEKEIQRRAAPKLPDDPKAAESAAESSKKSETSEKSASSAAERNEALMAWAESEFKRRDRNDDGYLNSDEVPDPLKEDFQKWDKNNDNLISLNEFRAYFQARFQSGARDDTPTTVTRIIEEEDLEIRPTVFRAGRLPKELPSWFQELDTDKDGQVALHEWRAARKDLDEFLAYDINDDGLLTPEEVLKHQAIARGGANRDSTTTTVTTFVRGGDERRPEGKGSVGGGKGGFGGFGKGGFGGFNRGAGGERPAGGDVDLKARFGGFGGAKGGTGPTRGGFGGGGIGGDRGDRGDRGKGGFRMPEFRRP